LRAANTLCIGSRTSRSNRAFDARRDSLKIAYLITRSDLIGGVQVHVRDLAMALAVRGHEPVVLTGGRGPYTDALRSAGVASVSLKHLAAPISPYRDGRALGEICSALRKLKPDLVSVHSSKASILGRLAGRVLGLPVVFTAHGWNFTPGIARREAAVYRWIERLASPLATRTITVSEFDRNLAVAQRVVSAERVVTIHNGMPDIDPSLQANPGHSPVRIVMIARFEPQKDHATLFQALAGLGQEPWHLDLIGDGPLLPEAQARVRELGLIERVRFWGQRMDVAERLADAQLAVLITNWEGFPRSILEAMRAGLPVVASAVGGIAESVQDGENGFVVSRGDFEGLRQRLRQLLANPGLRTRMGRSGRQRYERNFTLERTVTKTLEVYHQTVAGYQVRSHANDRGSIATKAEQP
jgi:glycosyltransferase involved in cell wall biosynthesis